MNLTSEYIREVRVICIGEHSRSKATEVAMRASEKRKIYNRIILVNSFIHTNVQHDSHPVCFSQKIAVTLIFENGLIIFGKYFSTFSSVNYVIGDRHHATLTLFLH